MKDVARCIGNGLRWRGAGPELAVLMQSLSDGSTGHWALVRRLIKPTIELWVF